MSSTLLYNIKNFSTFSKSEWDYFVDNNPRGFLWHTYDLISAKNTWHGHINISFAVTDKDNKILAVFPLSLIQNKSLRVFDTPILSNLGGWLVDSTNDENSIASMITENFRKILVDHSCSEGGINFNTASLMHDVDPLFKQGITGERAYSSVIDLKNKPEKIWNNFRKGHKTEIKKAEKHGVQFRLATPKDLDDYYEMHKNICAKSLLTPHRKEYFEHTFKVLLPEGKALIGVASLNNDPIAMVNYGTYNYHAVYTTGACFDRAYQTGANPLLHWYMMQHLIELGYSKIDMGEVFFKHDKKKLQGIADFKMGFGGKLFPSYKHQCINETYIRKIQRILGRIDE